MYSDQKEFHMNCHSVVTLDYHLGIAVEGMEAETESDLVDNLGICDVAISPENDVIMIVAKSSLAFLHRMWLSEPDAICPFVVKLEVEKWVSTNRHTRSLPARWMGGYLLVPNVIQVFTFDGQICFYRLPDLRREYSSHLS